MARHILGLLVISLGLLAGACSDQSGVGPSGVSDVRPSFKPTSPDTSATGSGGKKGGGPGGSAGGFK
jgi:hypothetical protein